MEIISRKEAIEKGLKRYFTGKPCKYGHVAERQVSNKNCFECVKIRDGEDNRRNYFKEYYKENQSKKKEMSKDWRAKNKHRKHLQNKTWKLNNKPSQIARRILERVLKETSSTKESQTSELLGYHNKQLKESVEGKFSKDMSWGNYGKWHIDHVYPISRYIQDGIEDPAIINALDNLIPMWAEHNLEKSDRTLEEYLDDRKDLVELYGRFL